MGIGGEQLVRYLVPIAARRAQQRVVRAGSVYSSFAGGMVESGDTGRSARHPQANPVLFPWRFT